MTIEKIIDNFEYIGHMELPAYHMIPRGYFELYNCNLCFTTISADPLTHQELITHYHKHFKTVKEEKK